MFYPEPCMCGATDCKQCHPFGGHAEEDGPDPDWERERQLQHDEDEAKNERLAQARGDY